MVAPLQVSYVCSGTDPFLVGFPSLMGFTRVVFSLDPILFTIYIDDLLVELEKQGISYFWRLIFVGVLCG